MIEYATPSVYVGTKGSATGNLHLQHPTSRLCWFGKQWVENTEVTTESHKLFKIFGSNTVHSGPEVKFLRTM